MSRFAFVYFTTQWREDLTWPLQVSLHSIDTRGGAAAKYPRYLIHAEEITPEIREFCDRHRLIVQREKRFTYRLSYPNKALMCRIPECDALCMIDLDIVVLRDPTPMFEETARSGKVRARVDLTVPLNPWPKLPKHWGEAIRYGPALNTWRAQYRRFARGHSEPAAEVPRPGGGTMPFYFNDGLVFMPGKHARVFGETWQHVSSRWLGDVALKRPYTFLFTNHFTSQIAFALALHRERIPWEILPSTHNFLPIDIAPAADRELLAGDAITMAHMVGPVRHWLDPKNGREPQADLIPLYRSVREVVGEVAA
jgi:hypothetical protein